VHVRVGVVDDRHLFEVGDRLLHLLSGPPSGLGVLGVAGLFDEVREDCSVVFDEADEVEELG
jgi:hypothetical protein